MSAPLSCEPVWADHACRFCGGRLLSRAVDGGTVFECGQCSVKAQRAPDAICGCGTLPRPASSRPGAAWPRWRCVPNPTRCVASPAAIVIEFGEAA